jgi:hypothetical protein
MNEGQLRLSQQFNQQFAKHSFHKQMTHIFSWTELFEIVLSFCRVTTVHYSPNAPSFLYIGLSGGEIQILNLEKFCISLYRITLEDLPEDFRHWQVNCCCFEYNSFIIMSHIWLMVFCNLQCDIK